MDLRVDTSLTSYSQFCNYHVVKTHTRSMWEVAGMEAAASQTGKRVSGSATAGHLSANTKPTCVK